MLESAACLHIPREHFLRRFKEAGNINRNFPKIQISNNVVIALLVSQHKVV